MRPFFSVSARAVVSAANAASSCFAVASAATAFSRHWSRLRRASAAWFVNRFASFCNDWYFSFHRSRLLRKNLTKIRFALRKVRGDDTVAVSGFHAMLLVTTRG